MDSDKPSFFERLSAFLLGKPEDREQLLTLLHSAHERQLVDADALTIIEGALSASEISVSDVMVPRHEMQVIDISDPLPEVIRFVNETGHSRFPVIDRTRDNVIGILLSKDLLRVKSDDAFKLRDWLRPVVFIPESKRLNVLLREFRISHNHMAVVVDEYAGVSGVITIEDVLEQIVGEIEDEYDFDEASGDICQDAAGRYNVKAQTTLETFNNTLGVQLESDECNTIGGLIMNHLGRVPRPRESLDLKGLRFVVLRADSRKLHSLLVSRVDGA